jgi:hypothetical protein
MPHKLEVFQKMEVEYNLVKKRSFIGCMTSEKARHNFAQMGTKWWNEAEGMNLIDNGSTNFFQEHFSLFRAFFRNIL